MWQRVIAENKYRENLFQRCPDAVDVIVIIESL
jgi:hypothetical protein